MITTLITALIGLAAGIAIGWLLAQSRHGSERTQLVSARDVLQAQVNTLNQQLSEDKTTADFIAYLKSERLLKALLVGHEHITMQDRFSDTAMEFAVGGNFLFHGQEVLFT